MQTRSGGKRVAKFGVSSFASAVELASSAALERWIANFVFAAPLMPSAVANIYATLETIKLATEVLDLSRDQFNLRQHEPRSHFYRSARPKNDFMHMAIRANRKVEERRVLAQRRQYLGIQVLLPFFRGFLVRVVMAKMHTAARKIQRRFRNSPTFLEELRKTLVITTVDNYVASAEPELRERMGELYSNVASTYDGVSGAYRLNYELISEEFETAKKQYDAILTKEGKKFNKFLELNEIDKPSIKSKEEF